MLVPTFQHISLLCSLGNHKMKGTTYSTSAVTVPAVCIPNILDDIDSILLVHHAPSAVYLSSVSSIPVQSQQYTVHLSGCLGLTGAMLQIG